MCNEEGNLNRIVHIAPKRTDLHNYLQDFKQKKVCVALFNLRKRSESPHITQNFSKHY